MKRRLSIAWMRTKRSDEEMSTTMPTCAETMSVSLNGGRLALAGEASREEQSHACRPNSRRRRTALFFSVRSNGTGGSFAVLFS